MRALLRALPLVVLGLIMYLALRDREEAPSPEPRTRFRLVDVAAEAGLVQPSVHGDPRRWYIPESNGNGAAWLDYDGDGDLDLFLPNGAHVNYVDDGARLEVVHDMPSKLYRNDGFPSFRDVSGVTGIDRSDWVNAVAVADVEGDGDPDLYLGCIGPDVLLRMEGTRFVEATGRSGLGNEKWAAGASFADADRDGWLDLYVANYCEFDFEAPPEGGKRAVIEGVEVAWGPVGENQRGINPGAPDRYFRNDGTGHFADETRAAGFYLENALCSYACVWSDVDGDGWQDLLVANDLEPSNLFLNQGNGRFHENGERHGFARNAQGRATSAMGLLVADIDMDGDMDVLRTNFDLESNTLHVNDGRGNFTDRTAAHGLADASLDRLGWSGAFVDVDLDGLFEIAVANGHVFPQAEQIGLHPYRQQSQLFAGLPHRSYGTVWEDATADSGPGLLELRSARGLIVGDPDDDGDPDLLIVDLDAPPRLLENRTLNTGRWLGLQLIGAGGNRQAYGARVQVVAGETTWTREVRPQTGLFGSNDPRLVFGLGRRGAVDEVRIRWPDGREQVERHLVLDQYHTVRERLQDDR
jgi:hypothetical protein